MYQRGGDVMSLAALLAGAQGGRGILFTGGGLALVIAALMAFLRFGTGGPANLHSSAPLGTRGPKSAVYYDGEAGRGGC